MVENLLENEHHMAKVEQAVTKRNEHAASMMGLVFWLGAVLAMVSAVALVATYFASHAGH